MQQLRCPSLPPHSSKKPAFLLHSQMVQYLLILPPRNACCDGSDIRQEAFYISVFKTRTGKQYFFTVFLHSGEEFMDARFYLNLGLILLAFILCFWFRKKK